MKRVLGVGLALAAIGVAGAIVVAAQPCGPLDRSGCVASFTVSDMTGLGDTIAVAPRDDGLIWVAGNRYAQSGSSRGLSTSIVVALIDVASGSEITRLVPTETGTPIQLALSPDGTRLAIANSTIYTHSADLVVIDSAGETLWTKAFDENGVVPDAEGHALALEFEADNTLFAEPLAFDPDGEAIEPMPVERRWIGATEVGVALPEGFVPWTYATAALSPDFTQEAILLRRFDIGSGPRAILEIRDISTAAIVVRHEIGEDLNAALAWDPLGRGVIVARAGAFEAGAGTQLRVYSAEARP